MADEFAKFCPRCGKSSIDRESHASPGVGLCKDCGTLFAVLTVKVGGKVIRLRPEADDDGEITRKVTQKKR